VSWFTPRRSSFRRRAQHIRDEGDELAERRDARDATRGHVLDTPEHPSRRSRAYVEMEDEGAVRHEIERQPLAAMASGTSSSSIGCHVDDRTTIAGPLQCNAGPIAVSGR